MKNFSILVNFLLAFLVHLSPVRAQPVLPHLFSDHMVIQREIGIPVWGRADSGENISVTLGAGIGQAVTGSDGRWKVTLPAMRAGGPFTLTVQGKKTIVFRDVMLGEVWVASGQSNMTYALSGATDAEKEIPNAIYPGIRFFTVPKKIALVEQEDTLAAGWEVCSPETAKGFSAVSYFFARDLQRALGVPVGIILSAWPGTSGEEWTDMDSLRRDPNLKPIAERWDASPAVVKTYAVQPTDFSMEFDDFEFIGAQGDQQSYVNLSNFDDGAAQTSTGGNWTYDWQAAPGTQFELVTPGRGGRGFAARVKGAIDGSSSSRIEASFKRDNSPSDLSSFAGIRFWVRGNGRFQFQTLQPTIQDSDNYSTDMFEATPGWKQVTIWFEGLKQAGWGVSVPLTLNTLTGFSIISMTTVGAPPHPPSGLYGGMIAPLQSYRIRGAIWYQGEGNTWRAYQYRTLLPALIAAWRNGWREGDFPILIVQLPNHGASPELGDSIWAELREAQLLTAKAVPNTGLAVTIDVGDSHNLHPPRKAEIGYRLAVWALGTTYGKQMVYSGPIYDSTQILGHEIKIHFLYTGTGLEARNGPLKGFSMAGNDRKFHWANARIEGESIVVSSPDVILPAAVRYAWAGSPQCNLYNKEGLPASPFRTDDWPIASSENK
ncbi:MAG TPA: CIA30 family protein [Candidatus Dormibacteraeota bacterium]|nr:CIA30 family protein [Candidatus Dormibacteraeota bacterium]